MNTVSVSPNFNDRPDDLKIDMLVIHYTGMRSCQAALQRLCDPQAKVSCHYLIDEDGTVCRLVDEDKRAWHAGVAWWRGAFDINARSIGIELVNPGHEFGYRDFPDGQMIALQGLARGIVRRHAIPARNVVGHGDVSPTRKQDPGERFDWRRLAAAGVGLWVDDGVPVSVPNEDMSAMLSAFGYDVSDLNAAIIAFQRHFRPALVNGQGDPQTAGVLKALLRAT